VHDLNSDLTRFLFEFAQHCQQRHITEGQWLVNQVKGQSQ